MNKGTIIQVICLAGCIVAWPAARGDKPEKGRPGHQSESQGDQGHRPADAAQGDEDHREPRGRCAFSQEERHTIQGYAERYNALPGKHERHLAPGLAKKAARGRTLPPGWEKKCVPGETLPAEVYAECHPLPPDLVVKLPSPPEPALTVTLAVGGKVVRLLKATREILDVFDVHVRL
jgi:hypothetical protein